MSQTLTFDTLQTWAHRTRGVDRASYVQLHPAPLLVVIDPLGDADAASLATNKVKAVVPRKGRTDPLGLSPNALTYVVQKRPGGNPHPGMITIGRASNNDLVLPSQAISNFHAWMFRDASGRWGIRDGHSSNGTTVGEERVGRDGLLLGDDALVGLGLIRCRFVTAGAFHTIARAAGW